MNLTPAPANSSALPEHSSSWLVAHPVVQTSSGVVFPIALLSPHAEGQVLLRLAVVRVTRPDRLVDDMRLVDYL
jgi:hypothetical protein